MDVSAVQAGLAARLAGIPGLRVAAYGATHIAAPAALVPLPAVDYHSTAARGSDRLTAEIHLLVGAPEDRASSDAASAYMDGAGARSVVAAIEGDRTLGGSCYAADVVRAEPRVTTLAGVDLLDIVFTVQIYGGS